MTESTIRPKMANAMMRLNDYATKHGVRFTEDYGQTGPPHNTTFVCTITISGVSAQGVANSKKESKNNAAANILQKLCNSEATIAPPMQITQEMPQGTPSVQNPKGQLNEYCQKNGLTTPKYSRVEIAGDSHQRIFTVSCTVYKTNHEVAARDIGKGRTLKSAEGEAAVKVFECLSQGKQSVYPTFSEESCLSINEPDSPISLEPISLSSNVMPYQPDYSIVASSSSQSNTSALEIPQGTSSVQNPKGQLNEFCQKNCLAIPKYVTIERTGEAHKLMFTVSCTVCNAHSELVARDIGNGKSLKLAEGDAAVKVFEYLSQAKNNEFPPISEEDIEEVDSPSLEPSLNMKNRLQELCQKNSLSIPEYIIASKSGQPQSLEFSVKCRIKDSNGDVIDETYGSGKSKKDAEIHAANIMLPRIKKLIDAISSGEITPHLVRKEMTSQDTAISLVDPFVVERIMAELIGRDLSYPEYLFQVTEPADPNVPTSVQHLCLAYSHHNNPRAVAKRCHYDIINLPIVGHGIGNTQDESRYDALFKLLDNVVELLG